MVTPRVYDVVVIGNPAYNVRTDVSDLDAEMIVTSGSVYSAAILAKADITQLAIIGAVGERCRDQVITDIDRFNIPEHYLINSNGTIEVSLGNEGAQSVSLLTAITEIRIRDIPEEFLNTNYVILNPVIREIHIEFMEWLSTSTDAKILLDPRFRNVGSNGKALYLTDHHIAEDALQFVDIVKPNHAESIIMTGEKDPFLAAEALVEAGCETAIITMGGEGSIVFDGSDFYSIPALDGRPVDTTGAGDAYFAGFVKHLLDGYQLAECGAFASALAGMVIQSPAGLNFVLNLKEVYQRSRDISEAITIR
ncbi:MAG: carbohydrate kinase family protein [Promethearchaeota archaeon]